MTPTLTSVPTSSAWLWLSFSPAVADGRGVQLQERLGLESSQAGHAGASGRRPTTNVRKLFIFGESCRDEWPIGVPREERALGVQCSAMELCPGRPTLEPLGGEDPPACVVKVGSGDHHLRQARNHEHSRHNSEHGDAGRRLSVCLMEGPTLSLTRTMKPGPRWSHCLPGCTNTLPPLAAPPADALWQVVGASPACALHARQ